MIGSAFDTNKLRPPNESRRQGICGYDKKMMLLSSYMHSSSWTGYLRKLGKEPVYFHDKLHRLGLNAILMLSLICAINVEAVNVRSTAVHVLILNPASHKLQVLWKIQKNGELDYPPLMAK